MADGNLELERTESGPQGNGVISPVGDVEHYFTVIGNGPDDWQNSVADKIVRAVNTHDDLLEALRVAEEYLNNLALSIGPIEELSAIRDALAKAQP